MQKQTHAQRIVELASEREELLEGIEIHTRYDNPQVVSELRKRLNYVCLCLSNLKRWTADNTQQA